MIAKKELSIGVKHTESLHERLGPTISTIAGSSYALQHDKVLTIIATHEFQHKGVISLDPKAEADPQNSSLRA